MMARRYEKGARLSSFFGRRRPLFRLFVQFFSFLWSEALDAGSFSLENCSWVRRLQMVVHVTTMNTLDEDATMKGFRFFCQHRLNPLHIFCRLREMGLSLGFARNVSRIYELSVYRFMF